MNRESNPHDSYKLHEGNLIIAPALIALVLMVLYLVQRVGLQNDVGLALRVLGMSLFLLLVPTILGNNQLRPVWYLTHNGIRLLGISFIVILALVVPSVAPIVGILAITIGYGLLVICISKWSISTSISKKLVIMFFSVVVGMGFAGIIWDSSYLTPLFVERLSQGSANRDTLLHASITGMTITHNVPSIGLDGIPVVQYHFGSHILFAAFARLVDADALKFYQLGYPVIFFPLFIASLLSFAAQIRAWIIAKFNPTKLIHPILLWALLAVAIVGVVPLVVRRRLGLNYHTFISESNLVALITMFILFSIFFSAWKQGFSGRINALLLIVIIPFLMFFLGITKVSFGFVLGLLYCYLFFRFAWYRDWRVFVSFVGSAVLLFSAYKVAQATVNDAVPSFSPLHYARVYGEPNVLSFFVVFYFWLWFYIIWRFLWYITTNDNKVLMSMRKHYRWLDVEIVVVVAVAGMIPGLTLEIGGGSAFYFLDIYKWVTIVFLLAFMPLLPLPTRRFIRKVSPRGYLLVAIAVAGAMLFSINAVLRPIGMSLKIVAYKDRWHSGLTDEQILLERLQKIADLPDDIKRETLMYVPSSNNVYWEITDRCDAVPLIGPALTQVAMLYGAVRESCDHQVVYWHEAPGDNLPTDDHQNTSDLCGAVQRRGFSQLIVLTSDASEEFNPQPIPCIHHLE